jgi:hypothetical protein
MADTRVDLAGPRAICQAVRSGGAAIFTWEWDDHFRAVLSPFRRSDSPTARSLLERSLGQGWRPDSIGGAAPAVLRVADAFDGLRPGQELFVSAPGPEVGTCACWWPWGDGETISVRIALVTERVPSREQPALVAELRSWFAV